MKIRAPPGTKNELLICTSEILRNKLVKASGDAAVAAGTAHATQFFAPSPSSMTASNASKSAEAQAAQAAAPEGVNVDADLVGCSSKR